MPPAWAVAVLSPPFDTLTYLEPEHLRGLLAPGQRVLVPLGRSRKYRIGLLLEPSETTALPAGIRLKPILWPLDQAPLLSAAYLDMVRQLARRQMFSPGRILGAAIPAGLRAWSVVFSLPEGNRTFTPEDLAALPLDELKHLAGQWAGGGLTAARSLRQGQAREVWQVIKDPPWPIRPLAKRQLALMEYLWERGPSGRAEISRDLGSETAAALKRLAAWGLIGLCQERDALDTPYAPNIPSVLEKTFDFTPEQSQVLQDLSTAMNSGIGESRLLFGVTGSGKSAIYMELARQALAKGELAFILVPEIALLKHMRDLARAWLPGVETIVYHGSLPPSAKEALFARLAGLKAKQPILVLGTRSAMFLPGPPPGLVVLDEEHDNSFKQEERLTYQVKEVAHYRVGQAKGLLLLGSATPDLKSFHAARTGHLGLVSLARRIGQGGFPGIHLVDIKALKPTEALLAPETMAKLEDTLAKGEQAMILLNRRGYASLLFCLDCGITAHCPNCDIALTYHKARERLLCHYCGLSEGYPRPCPNCGGSSFLPMGEGTQKLEEVLLGQLPAGIEILRLDRDSVRRAGRLDEILDSFAGNKAQVLVGTQMLSKGHHFPAVTLVIVADADIGLNLPDYRATERTFQLMLQASGRAGRGDRPGAVYIQTRLPGHYCWEHVASQDYEGFYQREIEIRQRRRYPPFVKLGLIRIHFPAELEDKGLKALGQFGQALRLAARSSQVTVMGPAPAPLAMLQGRRRYQCLLKAADWPSIRAMFAQVRDLPGGSVLSISLDLDPSNLL